jgi:hypothetical protein
VLKISQRQKFLENFESENILLFGVQFFEWEKITTRLSVVLFLSRFIYHLKYFLSKRHPFSFKVKDHKSLTIFCRFVSVPASQYLRKVHYALG